MGVVGEPPNETVPVHVARSRKGGQSFPPDYVFTLPAPNGRFTDKPVMATGPDTTAGPPGRPDAAASLWVLYVDQTLPKTLFAQGAALDSNGAVIMDFCEAQPGPPDDPFCPPRSTHRRSSL
jgi:hypothetical protein